MSWAAFERDAPDLEDFGRARLHGRVCYLATTNAAGEPRVHPVTPLIGRGHLFLFMEPTSPKGADLRRGSAYALHCGVEGNDGGGGEFLVRGKGRLIEDASLRATAAAISTYAPADRYVLFELSVEFADSTTYSDNGPVRQRWKASS